MQVNLFIYNSIINPRDKRQNFKGKSLSLRTPLVNDVFEKSSLSSIKYIENFPKICKDIQARFEKELKILTPQDIENKVFQIAKKTSTSKEEVIKIMTKLTQFANMKSLNNLGEKLGNLRIDEFFNTKEDVVTSAYIKTGVSINSVLNYLQKREQLIIPNSRIGTDNTNKAFILDDASLKFLDKLDDEDLTNFYQRVKDGEILFVELEGGGVKIDDKYYSCTILDGSQNLDRITEHVICETKKGKAVEDVLNGDFRERLNAIFNKIGADFDIVNKSVKTISLNTELTVNNIANNLKPSFPNADYIQKVIETITEKTDDLTVFERMAAKFVLAKYYDYMASIYSPDRFVELLKEKHSEIEKKVSELGKTMEDVVYICPQEEKSFDLVALQYARVNQVDSDKIIYYNGERRNRDLDGKVIVILDDIVGTGTSVLARCFKYDECINKQRDINILFAPIICSVQGENNIYDEIDYLSRTDKDFLVCKSKQIKNYYEFLKHLNPTERDIIKKIIAHEKGVGSETLCVGFHYMTPDNNSNLGGYLNMANLNNPFSVANKIHISKFGKIGKELLEYLNNM